MIPAPAQRSAAETAACRGAAEAVPRFSQVCASFLQYLITLF
jgi:hypothetical protein